MRAPLRMACLSAGCTPPATAPRCARTGRTASAASASLRTQRRSCASPRRTRLGCISRCRTRRLQVRVCLRVRGGAESCCIARFAVKLRCLPARNAHQCPPRNITTPNRSYCTEPPSTGSLKHPQPAGWGCGRTTNSGPLWHGGEICVVSGVCGWLRMLLTALP